MKNNTALYHDKELVPHHQYEMDNVDEGTQAKRRGNAVIVDHLTPPIESSGLYGNFSELHQKIHLYTDTTEPRLKEEYRQSILDLCEGLGIDEDVIQTKSLSCSGLSKQCDIKESQSRRFYTY